MDPLLCHYSSDGTPISTKIKVKAGPGPGQGYNAKGEGRATHEYLVQHGFYRRFNVVGGVRTVAMLRDPLPLTVGKGAWAVFSVAVAFQKTARQEGHLGLLRPTLFI